LHRPHPPGKHGAAFLRACRERGEEVGIYESMGVLYVCTMVCFNRDHNHNHNHLTTRVIPDHSHLSLSRHLLPHRAHCWTLTTDHGSLSHSHSLRLQPHFTNVGPQFHPPLNQFVWKIIRVAVQRWAPFPGPQTKQHGTGRTMVSKMCKIFAP
jgi:hypothetical protein